MLTVDQNKRGDFVVRNGTPGGLKIGVDTPLAVGAVVRHHFGFRACDPGCPVCEQINKRLASWEQMRMRKAKAARRSGGEPVKPARRKGARTAKKGCKKRAQKVP